MLRSAVPRTFPPVKPAERSAQRGETYPQLVELMQRLLAPDGCPWDAKQSYRSLRRYVLEEAAEVADAIDREDFEELRDELGDLLLQVAFLGELGRRDGHFGPDDIVKAIVDKLVRRHPHVFGDGKAQTPAEVKATWERIKAQERKAKKRAEGLLDSVPRGLTTLLRAQRVGEKVASVGFDWPTSAGPRAKLSEEVAELDEALAEQDPERIEAELGDALLALTSLARHQDIDADAALGKAVDRFSERFRHVEARVEEVHGGFDKAQPPLEQLESYWQEAKAREK